MNLTSLPPDLFLSTVTRQWEEGTARQQRLAELRLRPCGCQHRHPFAARASDWLLILGCRLQAWAGAPMSATSPCA